MSTAMRMRSLLVLVVLVLCTGYPVFAQMETATLSGVIQDPKGAVVPDVEVTATRIETGTAVTTKSNGAGIYFFTGLMPGHYHLMIHKPGFKEIAIKEFQLNVQDKLEQNFSLEIGSVSETVTVTAGGLVINTTDATVSTVVDRQFAENLPMNGRSFQTLIQLTPGVVTAATSFTDPGQFSVNGQRTSSNYFMVDGVSANIGVVPAGGLSQTASGTAAGFSVQGGTNSLVSVDAMQEFRIQTSTYAPEFGRTPGGQISIVTRPGTNLYHGTLFEYFRNDVLDANDWFSNEKGLPKPEERQNDFGGVLGGPILKDRTFFFFSYEGLRLRQPQTGITTVPALSARQSASPGIQPFLNAYPLPTGPEILDSSGNPTGQAPFNASFSNPSTLNATSLRVDHILTKKINLFGRYNYAPSELIQRGAGGAASLSTINDFRIVTQTLTLGSTWAIANAVANDFRFNYSRNTGVGNSRLDTFGGAIFPGDSALFPTPFTSSDSQFTFAVSDLQGGTWSLGKVANNVQRQLNFVDSLSWQKGSHSLRFGVDYRRLSPTFGPLDYASEPFFLDVPSVLAGSPLLIFTEANRAGTVLFHNFGAFAQDTWRVSPRLTVTYGLRWDVDFAPSTASGPPLLAVTNFNDPPKLALAPSGTPPFTTPYGNVAPRIGLAYQISQSQRWQTVLRGGFGVFYDLATQQFGDALFRMTYPFGAIQSIPGPILFGTATFPLTPAEQTPPPISVASLASFGSTLIAFDPHLKLPYTLQWNVALEQSLGASQTLSASYIGAAGRRLIQQEGVAAPNPSFFQANLISNLATSDYDAFQLQFQRRLSSGLQALGSYTFAHSIDTGSSSSFTLSNTFVNGEGRNANRGPSDFDIRHTFSGGVTYDIPGPEVNPVIHAVLRDWSLENFILVRSAPPVNVSYSQENTLFNTLTLVRPDVVPGQSLYLFGSECTVLTGGGCPGGKGLNPAAFTSPPVDPSTGLPLRQGDLGRNALRGFGAAQWDFAIHRDFPIHESLKLQFRAEIFNVLNHPNFGPPIGDLANPSAINPLFGQSTQTLGQSLGGGTTGSGFTPLYQIGGPRSIQLALKLQF
jgi:hypothetical protein